MVAVRLVAHLNAHAGLELGIDELGHDLVEHLLRILVHLAKLVTIQVADVAGKDAARPAKAAALDW